MPVDGGFVFSICSQHQPRRDNPIDFCPKPASPPKKGPKQMTRRTPGTPPNSPITPKNTQPALKKWRIGGVWGLNPGPLTMMKYPEAGGTQSENHTTRPTPHHTEALEKHRTVGFSAAKAVQGRSWAGRILVWPRATGGMCWLGAWRCLRWGWKVLLGLGGWDKVWERLAPPHACGFVAVAGEGTGH